MSDSQVIQLTYGDLKRLVKEIQKPTNTWQPVSEFMRKEQKTHDQMKYMREVNPVWFKLNERKTRWLIDTDKFYKKSA